MPFHPPEDTGIGYLLVIVLTALGTLARIAYNTLTGNPVTILMAVGQIIISIFASALVLMLAMRFQWQFTGTAVACGLAAWSGVAVVLLLEKKLLARMTHTVGKQ